MKKRVKQIIGAVFLIVAIVLTQVPASIVEAINNSADFERDGDKLISYTGTAEAVSVPNGVKTISAEAFAGNPYIKSVSFPSSVETIENGAFRNCSKLEKVYFSSGQSEIGSGAFAMCENLKDVYFSDTVLTLGAGVFAGDSRLKSVNLGKNPYFVIQNGALYNRDRTKLVQYFSANEAERYVMPDSVTDVERYAFWGSKNLEEVVLSANLYTIPEYMFSNCTDLRSISIPYSVRTICAKAFEDCTRLGNVSIPISVTSIHETAFDGCGKVRIVADEGTTAYEFYQNLKQAREEQAAGNAAVSGNTVDGLYTTGTQSVSDNSKDDAVSSDYDGKYDPRNPADVSKLDVWDYYANDGDDVLGKARIVANQAVVFADNSAAFSQAREDENERRKSFTPQTTIPDDGTHKIGQKAYYQNQELTDAAVEDGVTDIDDFAFARSTLTGIEIPEGVTHIGYGAFYHCDNLDYVSVPDTVTDIEPEAFEQTPYLEKWAGNGSDNQFLIVGDGILIAYKGSDAVVKLPDTVKKIAGGVFKDHFEIVRVELDDRLIEIGEDAFAGCSQLAVISGMGHIKKIADRAFAGCPLTQIHVGNEVKQIGLGAFTANAADAVIFESIEQLPAMSYEQTATRYDNADYRVSPFGDVPVAVISVRGDSFENTLFDENCLGFKGLVVSLPNGRDTNNRIAKLEYCTMLPNEGEENLKIPSSIRIEGKPYAITSADVDAFEAYTRLNQWTDQKIAAIILPDGLGQISDFEPELVLGAGSTSAAEPVAADNSGDSGDAENTQNTENGATQNEGTQDGDTSDKADIAGDGLVQTIVLGASYPMADAITATVADDEEKYKLYVNQTEDEAVLQGAVEKEFGSIVAGQLHMFDLKMVEEKSNIPISSFGQSQVSVTVPVSEVLYDQQICAVSLKDNGTLELLYGTKSEQDGKYYFTFRTNHFSPYGIYAGVGTAADQIREATASYHQQDASPDTGDDFNPGMVLAVAFGCLGLFLLLNGRKRA